MINSAERALFEQQPKLADARVFVHLTSHVEVREPAALVAAQQALGHLLAAIKLLNISVRPPPTSVFCTDKLPVPCSVCMPQSSGAASQTAPAGYSRRPSGGVRTLLQRQHQLRPLPHWPPRPLALEARDSSEHSSRRSGSRMATAVLWWSSCRRKPDAVTTMGPAELPPRWHLTYH